MILPPLMAPRPSRRLGTGTLAVQPTSPIPCSGTVGVHVRNKLSVVVEKELPCSPALVLIRRVTT
jgi:hypothetical protein